MLSLSSRKALAPLLTFPVLKQASAGQDVAELVYQHVRGTLRTARSLTRYNGVRACLRLLSTQVGTGPAIVSASAPDMPDSCSQTLMRAQLRLM